MTDVSDAPFLPFQDSLMLRFDISGSEGNRTHYITPFVTDGTRLYVFDEPSHDPEAFTTMLLDQHIEVTSRATGDLGVRATGRQPSANEERWARAACTEKFLYDQALQDLAQLGPVVVLENTAG
ncbi:MAG: hypothetical protein VX785_03495 [Actinomycetota bacterium]|nr:hypothetical protein [Acidimicrobiales bacterium]MEC8923215.1 hypothetical protein [Actinomycetota bacterium]MED5551752.1 hypothetical protein [Actinomycetota bacterium]MEE3188090.1 hypothetical protein [Actinomycetota bacterium]MEE3255797.1 hypothetical protein [Actinomycetota bacterium]